MWRRLLATICTSLCIASSIASDLRLIEPVRASASPTIRSLSPAGCLQPGSLIQLYGSNFGQQASAGWSLVLQRGQEYITLQPVRWSEQRIRLRLPAQLSAAGPARWSLGIQQRGRWLTDPIQQLGVCAALRPLQATALSSSSSSIPASPPGTAPASAGTAPRPTDGIADGRRVTSSSSAAAAPPTSVTTKETEPARPPAHASYSGVADRTHPVPASTQPTPDRALATASVPDSSEPDSSEPELEAPEVAKEPEETKDEQTNTSPPTEPSVTVTTTAAELNMQLLSMALPGVAEPQRMVDENKNHEPDQLVITTESMADAQRLAAYLRGEGARIKTRKQLPALGLVLSVFRTTSGDNTEQLITLLRQQFPTATIDLNHRYHLLGDTQTLAPVKSWSLQSIGWQIPDGNCAGNKPIGVLDTLADARHPALQQAAISIQNFTERESPAQPDHGTAIAVLLAGSAPSEFASLLPGHNLKVAGVFRQTDTGQSTTIEYLLYGLDWLIREEVGSVNLSLGGAANQVLANALNKTMSRGIYLIAAAGNSGPKAPPVYPAAQPGVIAVTALDVNNKPYTHANQGEYIDLAAPGVDIWVANDTQGGAFRSGTSYATAFVTAYIAQSGNTDFASFTVDLGSLKKDKEYGWGALQWTSCR